MSDSIVSSPNGVVNAGFDGDNEIPFENNVSTATRSTRSKRDQAVCVRNAYKHYGSGKHSNKVLQNFNMTVPKGTIYGLLGASGCGKTTLLSCLVGRRHLNSGDIWVLGGKPGTKSSGIPGRRVGYMPQETALFTEFSIRETMMFFGWIFSMSTKEIEERLNFLLKFLDLPSQNRLVKNLSGGQQRRVSFAVALMHDPELIVLDEPTVGVDPLLRQSIWNHLVQITKDGNKTVIITTHYIEEARQAHYIGMMRSGRLLAEASPSALLSTYGTHSLEDVFLLLSRMENNSRGRPSQLSSYVSVASHNWRNRKMDGIYGTEEKGVTVLNYHQSDGVLAESDGHYILNNNLSHRESTNKIDFCQLNLHGKMRALLKKNFLRLLRNIGVLFIVFALPIMIVILFCLAVGRPMTNLHLAVVNEEMNWTTKTCPLNNRIDFRKPSTLKDFSCHYLDFLPKNSLVIDYYQNVTEAKEAVKIGNAWGIVYFPPKFSFNIARRYSAGKDVNKKILNESTIRVWLDMSNQQIGLTLQRDLQYTFRDFAKWLLHEFEASVFRRNTSHHMYWEKLGDLPMQYVEHIYGQNNPDFQDFVAAGVILTIVFFLAVSLTASALIVDRAESLQDRSWVAGVSPAEILISHVLTQFTIMCSQAALVLIFMFLVFRVQCQGDLLGIITITLLQGLNGMSFGFLISSICDLERNAIQMALGSFYPILMLSGVIWPLEGMGTVMRYISYALPLTLATSSLRSMMSRGWGIDEPDVYWGFVASLAWITFFLALSFILVRSKRN